MLDKYFWNEYKRITSSPLKRITQHRKILEMNADIQQRKKQLSHYVIDKMPVCSIPDFEQCAHNRKEMLQLLEDETKILNSNFFTRLGKAQKINENNALISTIQLARYSEPYQYKNLLKREEAIKEVETAIEDVYDDIKKSGKFIFHEIEILNREDLLQKEYCISIGNNIKRVFTYIPKSEDIENFVRDHDAVVSMSPALFEKLGERFMDHLDVPYLKVSEVREIQDIPEISFTDVDARHFGTFQYQSDLNLWVDKENGVIVENPMWEVQVVYQEQDITEIRAALKDTFSQGKTKKKERSVQAELSNVCDNIDIYEKDKDVQMEM